MLMPVDTICVSAKPAAGNSTAGTLKRYVSGFSSTLLGTLASQASAYLTITLTARLLGVHDFGRLGTVQATLATVFGVSTVGVGITATRYMARYRNTDPARAGRILGLCSLVSFASGALFSAVLLVLAGTISSRLFHAQDLTGVIRLTAPYCLLMTMNTNQVGALIGFEAYGRLLRAQALQGATALALTAALTLRFGFDGAVISLPLSAVLAWFFAHLELRAECRRYRVRMSFRGAWSERGILTGFAIPASISALVGNLAIWWTQGILVRAPGGMQEMGLWTAVATMRSIVVFAPSVLNRVSAPILSGLHDHSGAQNCRRALWSAAAVATAGAAFAGIVLLVGGPFLLSVFGRGYARAGSLLPWVIGSAIVETYACSVCQAMFVHARMNYQVAIITGWAAVLITTASLTVPIYLGQGLAFSYFLTWCFAAIGYTLIALKLMTPENRGQLNVSAVAEPV